MNCGSEESHASTSTLLAAAVFLFLASVPSPAGTIQFHDLTETTGVSVSDTRMIVLFCGSSGCRLRIDAPLGATFLSTTFSLFSPTNSYNASLIAEGPGGLFPGTISAAILLYCLTAPPSDVLPCASGGQTSAFLQFNSSFLVWSPEQQQLVPASCSSQGGCQLTEDGTMQQAGTFTWIDQNGFQTVDTVSFQSNAPVETLEPSSLLLILAGVPVLGLVYRCRASQK